MPKIELLNERIEGALNNAYLGMGGQIDLNRSREAIFRYLINNMLKRTLNMFEYKGLPDTLSPRSIEKYLQGSGTCLIAEVTKDMILNTQAEGQEGIYAFPCKAGGVLDADYLPTRAVITSSYFGFSADYDLKKDKVVYAWNDSLLEGLNPLFSLYASELMDNIITLHFQEVNNRILSIITAKDEDERRDGVEFFKNYEDGKFANLMNEEMLARLKSGRIENYRGSAQNSIKDTLEARQWLLAHWNIELGLNDNYNMKRESLNENEIEANSDTLTPLLDDMYKCRQRMVSEINERFGLSASVDFSSSWKRVHRREENAQKAEDLEIEAMEKQVAEEENDDAQDIKGTDEQ